MAGRILDDHDPSIQYRNSFTRYEGEAGEHAGTDTAFEEIGGGALLNFLGTGIRVTCTSSNNSTMSYKIDDETPQQIFNLYKGYVAYNQTFFERRGLPRGGHRFWMEHVAGYTQIDYLTIFGEEEAESTSTTRSAPQTGSQPPTGTQSSITSDSSSVSTSNGPTTTRSDGSEVSIPASASQSSSNSLTDAFAKPGPQPSDIVEEPVPHSSRRPTAAIIGGAVGGALLIVFVIIAILYIRRRWRHDNAPPHRAVGTPNTFQESTQIPGAIVSSYTSKGSRGDMYGQPTTLNTIGGRVHHDDLPQGSGTLGSDPTSNSSSGLHRSVGSSDEVEEPPAYSTLGL